MGHSVTKTLQSSALMARGYLGDQGRVAHGGGQADAQPLQVAVHDVGLGDEGEGAQIAQTDPSQDDVAKLPAGGLHHRGVSEPGAVDTRIRAVPPRLLGPRGQQMAPCF